MTYTFELNEVDAKFAEAYAQETGESVGEMAKNALLDGIEDIMDLRAYKKAKTEFEADPVTYSMDEVRAMLGID